MVKNPLKPYISDNVFEFLIKNNLLREKGVRDFKIKKRFNELKSKYPTYKTLEIIQKEYPYLSYETIRKIIYQKYRRRSEEFFYLF